MKKYRVTQIRKTGAIIWNVWTWPSKSWWFFKGTQSHLKPSLPKWKASQVDLLIFCSFMFIPMIKKKHPTKVIWVTRGDSTKIKSQSSLHQCMTGGVRQRYTAHHWKGNCDIAKYGVQSSEQRCIWSWFDLVRNILFYSSQQNFTTGHFGKDWNGRLWNVLF